MLLLLMGGAGLVLPRLPLMDLYPDYYDYKNIILFAVLMVVMIIPWIKFDSFFPSSPRFVFNEIYARKIGIIIKVLILLSLYAIIYTLPTAILAYSMGADQVRGGDVSLLPQSILTTIAVASGCLSPLCILLFYVSMLSNSLRKYSFWLFISSMAYIVTTMAFCARDGFVFTPMMYLFLYVIFKDSLNNETNKIIRRYAYVLVVPLVFVISKFTLDRFGGQNVSSSESLDDLLYGTWGYFYQQPYVFDHKVSYFHDFYGFERRLHFMEHIIPLHGKEYVLAEKFEFMFGTQLGDFYEINGFSSLFACVFVYVLGFYKTITHFIKSYNITGLLLSFTIYLYFTLTGLFYFRVGGIDNVFFLYIALLISSYFIPKQILFVEE